jgi:hypothetical protein
MPTITRYAADYNTSFGLTAGLLGSLVGYFCPTPENRKSA